MKKQFFILFLLFILVIVISPASADLFNEMNQKVLVYNQNVDRVPGVIKSLLGNEEIHGIIDLNEDWKGSYAKEFKRRKAAGDKAYSSRVNCQAVADKEGKPFLCFKANATAKTKAKGYPAWQISFEACV